MMVYLIFKLVVAAVFGFVLWKLVPMLSELPQAKTYNCSLAPAALANIKPEAIFDGIEKGAIQAGAGLRELETRLADLGKNQPFSPQLMLGEIGDSYRAQAKELQNLIPRVKELQQVQAAAADEQAKTYNCSLAEISPDYSPAVREQCRKLK